VKPEQATLSARPITLEQFLKFTNLVETGGTAKQLIQSGQVKLNGQTETRRRKKLSADDVVLALGQSLRVADMLSPE
jgi:ribosome-associated protein